MATDNGFGALKGVVVEPQSSEQQEKEIDKMISKYLSNDDKANHWHDVFVAITKQYDATKYSDGDNVLYKDALEDFNNSIKKLETIDDEMTKATNIADYTKILKQQTQAIEIAQEKTKKIAEITGISIKTIEEDLVQKQEHDNEARQRNDEHSRDEADNVKTDNVEEKISWHEAKEEAQDHGKDNLMIREELSVIQKEISKMDKAIDKLKKGTEKNNAIKELGEFRAQSAQKLHKIVQEKIVIEGQRKKDETSRKKSSKNKNNTVESDSQVVEMSLKKYDDIVERAKKDYPKNKRIKNILDQTGRKVKAERGVINIKNKKKRDVEVKKLQAYVIAVIDQLEKEMQNTDKFLSLVKEFGRTKTVYYDTNDIKNKLKIISYDGKNDGAVTYENGDGRQICSAEEFRTVISNMKKEVEQLELDDAEYSQLVKDVKKNYKKNKKLQEFVNAVDESVKKKKEKLKKETNPKQGKELAQALQKYLTDVTAQIQDRISSADQKNNTKSSNKKDSQGDDIEQKQKKRSDFFEERYGSDVDDAADILELDDELNNDVDDNNLVGVDENLFSADTNDRSNVGDTLQLDDELEDVDENLFGNDTSDESVTEDLDATKVQIEGIEDFEESEREIITSVFVFAQKTFEGVDSADEEKMLEFAEDIKREFIEEYSVVEKQRLEKMTQIILDNLDIDSSTVLQPSQENDATTKEKDDEKEDGEEAKSELEKNIGSEVFQFALEEIQLFYNDVGDNADWGDMDDMEKEDRLAEMVDEFIEKIVEMIDWESAQNYLTKQEKMELFKKSFFVE